MFNLGHRLPLVSGRDALYDGKGHGLPIAANNTQWKFCVTYEANIACNIPSLQSPLKPCTTVAVIETAKLRDSWSSSCRSEEMLFHALLPFSFIKHDWQLRVSFPSPLGLYLPVWPCIK